MKKNSTKILSMTLAAGCWLAQQAWAQAPAQSSAPQPQATAGNPQAGTSVPAQAQPDSQTQKTATTDSSAAPGNNKSGSSPDDRSSQPVTTYPDASGAEQKTP